MNFNDESRKHSVRLQKSIVNKNDKIEVIISSHRIESSFLKPALECCCHPEWFHHYAKVGVSTFMFFRVFCWDIYLLFHNHPLSFFACLISIYIPFYWEVVIQDDLFFHQMYCSAWKSPNHHITILKSIFY